MNLMSEISDSSQPSSPEKKFVQPSPKGSIGSMLSSLSTPFCQSSQNKHNYILALSEKGRQAWIRLITGWHSLSISQKWILSVISIALWWLFLFAILTGVWIAFIGAIAYIILYGFDTLIEHGQETLQKSFGVSEQSLKHIQENAEKIKKTAQDLTKEGSQRTMDLINLIGQALLYVMYAAIDKLLSVKSIN